MSPLRVLLLALCLAALASLSAGQVSRAQQRLCRSQCEATLSGCKAACGADLVLDYAAQRCQRKCDEAAELCKRDCRTVEADLTERQKKVWAKSGAASLEPVPAPFAPEQPAVVAPEQPVPALEPTPVQPSVTPAAQPAVLPANEPAAAPAAPLPQAPGLLAFSEPTAPAPAVPAVAPKVEAAAAAADAAVPPAELAALNAVPAPIVPTPVSEAQAAVVPGAEPTADDTAASDAAVARAEEAAAAAAAVPTPVAAPVAANQTAPLAPLTDAPVAPVADPAALAPAAPAEVAPAEPNADDTAAAEAAVARAEDAAVAPAATPVAVPTPASEPTNAAAPVVPAPDAASAPVAAPAASAPAAPAPVSEPGADEAAAAQASVARAEESLAAPVPAPNATPAPAPAPAADAAANAAPASASASASDDACTEACHAQRAACIRQAETTPPPPWCARDGSAECLRQRKESCLQAERRCVQDCEQPAADVPVAADPAAELPIVASTAGASPIPASIAESAPFNLNAGGGVWRRGQPTSPRFSPAFTPSNVPRRMTVAQLPVQAKLCMLLEEASYRVKAVSMCPQVGSSAASASEWQRVLQTFAREFRGSELQARLTALRVVSSSWDSALLASRDADGKYSLWVGGHGSVMNSADWLGQNLGLSRVSQFIGTTVNWISSFFGKDTRVDLPRQRSARWVEAVERAMLSQTYKDKVSKIHLFGHSMSAYQGHLAAEDLTARYPRVVVEAWLLNPGGNPPLRQTTRSGIHHLVVPGEAMQMLALGDGDPRRIELQLQNIDHSAYSAVSKPVYLHGIGLVIDDIRQFAGVAASVEVCTRPSQSRQIQLDCYLRALDGSAAFQYDKANGVHLLRNAQALPKTQCVTVPGVYMQTLRGIAASDAASREWSRGASYNDLSHNSCHWVNRALFAAGSTSVDSFLKGTLPRFKKFAN